MPALPSAPERLFGTSATLRDHDGTQVLLIGGNTHATETLVELLEAIGYQVKAVATGSAARLQRIPDVLIADMCLPDGSAFDVVTSLKRQFGWNDVPAIGLGRLDPSQPDQEEARGFKAVLPKPVSIWALHRAVQDALCSKYQPLGRRW